MMTSRLIKLAAWLALAAVLFATASPIGLRPHDMLPVNIDRALAFTVLAALFILAYPRHWLLAAGLCVSAAFGIELLQLLSPTRHAHLFDANVKAAGAAVGVLIGWTLNELNIPRRA